MSSHLSVNYHIHQMLASGCTTRTPCSKQSTRFAFDIIQLPRPDPNGIIAFLVSQLQIAEDAGQRVWIIGHVPPGAADAFPDQVGDDDLFSLWRPECLLTVKLPQPGLSAICGHNCGNVLGSHPQSKCPVFVTELFLTITDRTNSRLATLTSPTRTLLQRTSWVG
jgi:hypothetical protein